MLPGRGKMKGNSWEREVGRDLSMWLTDGQRTNIFARNVLSGGGFTVTTAKGVETPNIPGDLMAASPLAFAFLSMFSIECKNTESIDLDGFLYDTKGKSFLMKTIVHTKAQADAHGVAWLIIAKQNRQEPFVLTEQHIGREIIFASAFPHLIKYHLLHTNKYMMMPFDHFTRLSNATRFVNGIRTSGFIASERPTYSPTS